MPTTITLPPDATVINPALDYLQLHVQFASDPVLTSDELIMLLACSKTLDSNQRGPTDPGYITTYDLPMAVASGWELKAAKVAGDYKESHEGLTLERQQVYEHCIDMAKKWASRSTGVIHTKIPIALKFPLESQYDSWEDN